MRNWMSVLAVAGAGVCLPALAQDGPRFDRPLFTTDTTVLCPRQDSITALRRALDDNDRPAADRITAGSCKLVGPDLRLGVVHPPGRYDPDVEVRVGNASDLDPGVPRGPRWTLKSMLRN